MQKFGKKTLLIAILLPFLLGSFASFAKNSTIIVKGNERIAKNTILSYVDITGLQQKSPQALQKSLKKLYESDLFLESKIYYQKQQIIIEIIENPIILEVKFVGNKKIEDETLQNELILKKRAIFTKAKLQNDLKRINEIYLKSGRFLTKIEPKIIQKEQNRIELIFDVFEGPVAKISEIYFIGNKVFSDSELSSEITTKKSKWWKFLSSSDTYDSDRIEFDKEKLRRFYGSKGYADFSTISAIAQISPNKDRFFVNFLLEEGIKYNIGKIDIVNYIKKFDETILQDKILIKESKLYNSDLIQKSVDKMTEVMSQKSYAFARIRPILKRNREAAIIDIDFVIEETPRIYIDQIIIKGNVRTIDKVLRRELRIKEGDPYNINKINRSKQRLQNLGFFEKVDLETKRINESDKVNIIITVKEKKTGEVSLGLGYSTVNRLTTSAGLKERNLFGTGQELGINVQKSFANLSANLNYSKPYFLNREINVGFDIFKYEMNSRNTLIYDQNSGGITLKAGYSVTEFLTHQVRYSLSNQEVTNINENASLGVQNLEGSFVSSTIGQTFLYDKRDNRLNPKSGYYISLSQNLTGLGGDIKTLKHEGSAGFYTPTFNDKFILKFLARGGYIDGLGQDVRSNYGFLLGGNNFRGFEFAGLGPRYLNDNSVVGGNGYYVGTVEFMFPLGLPKELGINGILFSDNGTVKGVDQINKTGSDIVDSGSLRSSYGFSIAWSSPMGPIRLDFAQIAKSEDYDQTQSFRFSFGTNF